MRLISFAPGRPLRLLLLCMVSALASGCELARTRLYSSESMYAMGVDAYADAKTKHKIVTGTKEARMVEEVGRKIAAASKKDFEWEFTLFDAPEVVNAFCLPGGKIAVYSGLFKVATDIDSLAAVMGHEVAHATMEHGNERLTQRTIGDGLNAVAGLVLGAGEGEADKNNDLILGALGLSTKLGILGYSRMHETEADVEGLKFLIRAGYKPEAAPALWERMAKLGGGQARDLLSGFLSTHPHPLDRAKKLREIIPKVKAEVAAEQK